MAGFNPFQLLKILSPGMIWRSMTYPRQVAIDIIHATQPDLRGTAFWNAVRRLRQAEPVPPLPSQEFTAFGDVRSIEQDSPHEVTIVAQGGILRITALADDLILLRASRTGTFEELFSYSVAKAPSEWPGKPIRVLEGQSQATLVTDNLRLQINLTPCRVTLLDPTNQPLLSETTGAAFHPSGAIRWEISRELNAPHYGLGSKPFSLNLAGRRYELFNTDPAGYDRGRDPINMSIPFVLTLLRGGALGLFFDTSYRAWVDLGSEQPEALSYQAVNGELRIYIFTGEPTAVLERYTELTGRMSMPPLWALGLHQSRWSYYPARRVRRIARQFRKRRLPCDVIHLDIHYMRGYRCFTWHPRRFRKPRRLTQMLHERGFKVLAMIDPGIKVDPGYHVYKEGLARGAFIKYPDGTPYRGPVWPGYCHFPDFTDPRVRSWWGDLYSPLIEDGVDAFWNDMNEIALITAKPASVPDVVQHSYEGRGASHDRVHNVYGMQMARASVEGLARLRPERRPFILTRSGWAGIQRYAAHWTGDNGSTWDHLRLSISMVLNLGLSGVAFTGPDTGGFAGTPTPELFARWMQLGALTPFFRVHTIIGSPNQEPWSFGREVEAISRRYLELRYRLLPYIYTTVWQASIHGTPIMRPLSLMYPTDTRTHSLEDEYLFGDSLLVAPILDEGAISRQVYLPEGSWYDFWSRQQYHGPAAIQVEAPLEVLPLFVRAGAVLPLWPVQQYVGEKTIEELELQAYWGQGEHHSMLYEDDGVSTDYQKPVNHRRSRFTLRGASPSTGSLLHILEDGEYQPSYQQVWVHLIGLDQRPKIRDVSGARPLEEGEDPSTGAWRLRLEGPRGFMLSLS